LRDILDVYLVEKLPGCCVIVDTVTTLEIFMGIGEFERLPLTAWSAKRECRSEAPTLV
jgi:hypothetical protein